MTHTDTAFPRTTHLHSGTAFPLTFVASLPTVSAPVGMGLIRACSVAGCSQRQRAAECPRHKQLRDLSRAARRIQAAQRSRNAKRKLEGIAAAKATLHAPARRPVEQCTYGRKRCTFKPTIGHLCDLHREAGALRVRKCRLEKRRLPVPHELTERYASIMAQARGTDVPDTPEPS